VPLVFVKAYESYLKFPEDVGVGQA
jgi:hypothetical protein